MSNYKYIHINKMNICVKSHKKDAEKILLHQI